MKKRISLIVMFWVLVFKRVLAQGNGVVSDESNYLIWIIYIVIGLLLLITYILYLVSRELKRYVLGEEIDPNQSSIQKLFQINPVSTDDDVIIDESHDGIYELDNPPPPWFMFLFYGCILFALVYFVRFSLTDYGYSQEDEYALELKAAETRSLIKPEMKGAIANIDENNVVELMDKASLDLGKSIYIQNCKICHGQGGKGLQGSGPNLTDEYWKHGGGVLNIFKTVKYGVIEKGMVPWKDNLSPIKIQQVVSYILSIQGTNPEGAKAPEGDLWVPVNDNQTADSTSVVVNP
mgnify:CR=1 FL=1